MYKLNFDGASKGNPGPASYGGICRDHSGRILSIFLGSLGSKNNNSAELEGLICGFEILIRGGYFSAIIEGDTRVLIQMAKKMVNGKDCTKVAMSWHLASRMDSLKTMFRAQSDVTFCHVKRTANKAANLLANANVEGDAGLRIGSLEEFNADAWA